MLSVINIIKSLSELIETNFPDYPINDRDIEEGFDRPCYFIDIGDVYTEMVTYQYVKEEANLEVYFFAKDIYEGFLDLLKMKSQLLLLLSEPLVIKVDDEVAANVVFNEINLEISNADKVLKITMTSELIQGLPSTDDNLPEITELSYHL